MPWIDQPTLPFVEPLTECLVCHRLFAVRVNTAGRWRRFCSTGCRRARVREQNRLNAGNRRVDVTSGSCIVCGAQFSVTAGRKALKRFCSNRCRHAFGTQQQSKLRQAARVAESECIECGQPFTRPYARGALAKTCSDACRVARRLRQCRAWHAERRQQSPNGKDHA